MTHEAAALLRDFASGDADQPERDRASEPTAPVAFEPLLPLRRRPATAPAFTPLGAKSASDEVQSEGAETPHVPPPHSDEDTSPAGAAALQAMLEDAFVRPSPAAPSSDEIVAAANAQIATLQSETERLTAELEATRADHAAQIAAVTARALPDMARQVADALDSRLAPVLGEGVFDVVKAQAIGVFVEQVVDALGRGEGATIKLSAPPDLVGLIEAAWPDGVPMPAVAPADGIEMTAELDGAVIETRLAAVRAALVGGR